VDKTAEDEVNGIHTRNDNPMKIILNKSPHLDGRQHRLT